jgi:thiol-disulfide isomerase/thioredoxin
MLEMLALVAGLAAGDAEQRVVDYLRENVKAGQPVVASKLANEVFTAPEERAALDRLFGAFFKLPLYAAQFQKREGRPPTLVELQEQLRLGSTAAVAVLLQVAESDPRMPRFLERDPKSGEIRRVDVDAVLASPRFGKELERSLSGLEGHPAPPFQATRLQGGGSFDSASLAGKAHLVYFWFSHCPPCMQTAPVLAELAKAQGFPVVAVNADRALDLDVADSDRADYTAKLPGFTHVHATAEILAAYGGVSVYPTLVFVDKGGNVVRQMVNRQERAVLEAAVKAALAQADGAK